MVINFILKEYYHLASETLSGIFVCLYICVDVRTYVILYFDPHICVCFVVYPFPY